jgi:hypothetical protein
MWGFQTKLSTTVKQTADVTEASSTNPVNITGMSVALPRAGVYQIQAVFPYTANATSKTMGIGFAFSGTTATLDCWALLDQPGGVVAGTQISTMGTMGAATGRTSTSGRIVVMGTVTVTTAGTLTAQFSRSAGSTTQRDGVMTIREG